MLSEHREGWIQPTYESEKTPSRRCDLSRKTEPMEEQRIWDVKSITIQKINMYNSFLNENFALRYVIPRTTQSVRRGGFSSC